MKLIFPFALAAALALSACQKKEQTARAPEEVKLFEKGKGLRLPEQTCQMIGVETFEVAEKPFRRRLEVSAQVYETNGGTARAVAILSAAQGEAFQSGANITLADPGNESNRITGQLIRLEKLGSQIEALLELPDAARRLPVGTFTRAVLSENRIHSGLAVPEGAVIHGAEGAFVYAVNGAHFTRTPIKTGVTSDGFTEVVDGLYPGDAVAAKATEPMWMIELYALKGGTPCCPVPKKNTAR